MNVLTLWLIALMTVLSPPEKDAARAARTLHSTETGEERAHRYESIAADISSTVKGHALPHMTERETALLLTSVMFYESSFNLIVDSGDCNAEFVELASSPLPRGQKPLVHTKICDGGQSAGLMQLHFEKNQKTFLGKTFDELLGVQNRRTMLATGLSAIRIGITTCERQWKHENPGWKIQPGLLPKEAVVNAHFIITRGLAWYARGGCENKSGLADGAKKLRLLNQMRTQKRFPKFESIVPAVADTL